MAAPKKVSKLLARAFAAQVKLEHRKVQELAKQKQAILAEAVYEEVLVTTPVLTGRAREHWHPNLNSPDTTINANVAGVENTGEDITAKEKARISYVLKELMKAALGQVVYIANGLKYVAFLDKGSSQKAPLGIRTVALQKALAKLRSGTQLDLFK